MTAIEKMEHYLNCVDRMDVSFADILLKCRDLAAEEAKEKPTAPASLVEDLAALEHEQWMAWAMSISATEVISQERIDRWKKCLVPYAELTEQMKEFDRIWARKAAEIISRYRPTPTEDIVGELKDYLNNECPPIAWYSLTPEEKEYFKGVEAVQKRIGEIIRKYEEGK